MTSLDAEALRRSFVQACRLDVEVRKPGNVSVVSPGHGMDAGLFIASAHAAALPLCDARLAVGERIEAAVQAAIAVAHCNTNLGIVLLCAPLARAAERWRPAQGRAALRAALSEVLAALDVHDAACAFRAIAQARPAGLGRTSAQDVHRPPTVGLREAMALAQSRDRIAAQYTSDFADVFELALPAFEAAAPDRQRGMCRAYLELLAAWPDSHIVRKHGVAVAHSVMAEAAPWRARARAGEPLEAQPAFAEWDASLKARSINPGTSADLCVAASWVDALLSLRHAPSQA
ncbi:MAG TPA: triphosphoribosyl-dephospho-CoA synthase [Burkholderiaceae bacterium]|nr:triphosphoribosyl-dephospho-CoA synthase [Burkholderiaceae bacterium]